MNALPVATVSLILVSLCSAGAGSLQSTSVDQTAGPRTESPAKRRSSAPVTASADLAIKVTASPDPVPAHWPIIYSITVTNLGPDVATSVTVTEPDQAFPGIGFGSFTLAPGESKMILVAHTVTGEPGSALVFTANVSGDQTDPNLDNNTATVSTAVVPAVPEVSFISIDGKNLVVTGFGFDDGAVIVLNGEDRKTTAGQPIVLQSLIGKKAAKRIAPGQTVTVQVRDANGNLSDSKLFTRALEPQGL